MCINCVNAGLADVTTKQTTGDSNLSSSTTFTNSPSGRDVANDVSTISVVIGIVTAILIVLIATVVIALVLFWRKSVQQKSNYDTSYSTVSRENAQQVQPQSLHTPAELYDQIQLSPSTGQAEFVSNTEIDNINNSSPPPSHNIHPSVDTGQPKCPSSATQQINLSLHDEEECSSEQPTYAVVNEKKKRERVKESAQGQDTIPENERDLAPLYNLKQRDQPKQRQDVHESTYAIVHKKSKKGNANTKETATPIPSQKIDSPEKLYTAVKKKQAEDEEEVPPLPPRTVEELYTAIKKEPKGSTAGEAPPLPSHTVEELYTAVQKNIN